MERTTTFKNGQIKRTKALKFLALTLVVLFGASLTISYFSAKVLFNVWFSLSLGLIGIYLITRSIFFFMDSNMLFGSVALSFALISGLDYYFGFTFVLKFYILALSLSFLLVYFIFRQNFYIISFALGCLEVLLLIVNRYYLSNITFLFLQALLFIAVFVFLYLAIAIKRKS
ncbi:MAG: hypothetical protein ACOX6H_03770 [Christensenellales bacterium]|jgi:hypothetical protein